MGMPQNSGHSTQRYCCCTVKRSHCRHAKQRTHPHLKLPASMPFSFHMYTPSATPMAVMPLLRRQRAQARGTLVNTRFAVQQRKARGPPPPQQPTQQPVCSRGTGPTAPRKRLRGQQRHARGPPVAAVEVSVLPAVAVALAVHPLLPRSRFLGMRQRDSRHLQAPRARIAVSLAVAAAACAAERCAAAQGGCYRTISWCSGGAIGWYDCSWPLG